MVERKTAVLHGDFAVFLIGGRFTKFWRVHEVFRIYRLFRSVTKELKTHPRSGYLGGEIWLGRTILNLQYWRSIDQLLAYANDTTSAPFSRMAQVQRYIVPFKQHRYLPRDLHRQVRPLRDDLSGHATLRTWQGVTSVSETAALRLQLPKT